MSDQTPEPTPAPSATPDLTPDVPADAVPPVVEAPAAYPPPVAEAPAAYPPPAAEAPAAPAQWPAQGYVPPPTYPAAAAPTYPPAPPAPPVPPAYALAPTYAAPASQTSSNAIIALILAVVSWAVCPLIAAIVALVFAANASKEIAASGGRVEGQGLVTAARIVAWINIGLTAAVIVIIGFFLVLAAVAGGMNTSG